MPFSEPRGESSAQNFLAFLATGGRVTYTTGLVKRSDHSSPRKLLRLNDSVATSKIKNILDMVSGKKRGGGGEHQGDSQAKVDILRVSSNVYLYYFDRVLIRGQPI